MTFYLPEDLVGMTNDYMFTSVLWYGVVLEIDQGRITKAELNQALREKV